MSTEITSFIHYFEQLVGVCGEKKTVEFSLFFSIHESGLRSLSPCVSGGVISTGKQGSVDASGDSRPLAHLS